MDVDTKYKRWGWGAVIGLIAVILIAGLVVAITMSSPKKSEVAEGNDDDTSIVIGEVDSDKTEDKKDDKAEDKKDDKKDEQKDDDKVVEDNVVTSDTSNGSSAVSSGNGAADSMPKTGPAEDMFSFVVLAVIAGLAAHNIILVKNRA